MGWSQTSGAVLHWLSKMAQHCYLWQQLPILGILRSATAGDARTAKQMFPEREIERGTAAERAT